MIDLIAQLFMWLIRATAAPAGRHRPLSVVTTAPSARRQHEGLTALLAVARPTPAPARLPVRRRRVVIPLDPAPDPILMDGDDPRRYRFIRPSYRSWERQTHTGDFKELADAVRLALSMGIGR